MGLGGCGCGISSVARTEDEGEEGACSVVLNTRSWSFREQAEEKMH